MTATASLSTRMSNIICRKSSWGWKSKWPLFFIENKQQTSKQNYWNRKKMDFFFADDIFKSSFLNRNRWISNKISVKDNKPALVQIMASYRTGDIPLSEECNASIVSSWWRHQMETFSVLLHGRVRGIHLWPVNSPHKGQWRGALMFCLIYAWTNGWVNNRDAGDLRRHRAHYDVTVMELTRHSCEFVEIND